jgi:hypothetical protein
MLKSKSTVYITGENLVLLLVLYNICNAGCLNFIRIKYFSDQVKHLTQCALAFYQKRLCFPCKSKC